MNRTKSGNNFSRTRSLICEVFPSHSTGIFNGKKMTYQGNLVNPPTFQSHFSLDRGDKDHVLKGSRKVAATILSVGELAEL
jgi:hypothetical protein